ncbi:MAG: hypothetical protein AAGE43_20455, partial [Pseudomonadota bacterium]
RSPELTHDGEAVDFPEPGVYTAPIAFNVLAYAGAYLDDGSGDTDEERRENLQVLRARNIAITPANHRVLLWLPAAVIAFLMKRMLASRTMAIKIGHAEHALGEFRRLAEELQTLNAPLQLPTPAMDQLSRYFKACTA